MRFVIRRSLFTFKLHIPTLLVACVPDRELKQIGTGRGRDREDGIVISWAKM